MPVVAPPKPDFNAARRKPVLARAFEHLFHPKPKVETKPALKPSTDKETLDATALIEAVRRNDHDEVKRLLQAGVNPQMMSKQGELAVVVAVKMGAYGLAKRLTDAGADPRATDGIGRTAVGEAWLQASGGPKLDPTIHPEATGLARQLYEGWRVSFPVSGPDDYFSPNYRNTQLNASQATRLEMDGDWKPGIDLTGDTGRSTTAWVDIDSHRSLLERQRARRARLVPEPEHEIGVGRLPTAPSKASLTG